MGQISVFDQNSKELLKNLKYFLRSGPIFEKSVQKGGQKGGFGWFGFFSLFDPISPVLPCFGPHLGGRLLNLGLRAKPRGLITNLGRPHIGARPHLGNGVTIPLSDVRLILGTATSWGMA